MGAWQTFFRYPLFLQFTYELAFFAQFRHIVRKAVPDRYGQTPAGKKSTVGEQRQQSLSGSALIVAAASPEKLERTVQMYVRMGEKALSGVLGCKYLNYLAVFLIRERILTAASHGYEPVRPETVCFIPADYTYNVL
jgi:hypothetical protein